MMELRKERNEGDIHKKKGGGEGNPFVNLLGILQWVVYLFLLLLFFLRKKTPLFPLEIIFL